MCKSIEEKASKSSGLSHCCNDCVFMTAMRHGADVSRICRKCNQVYREAYIKGYKQAQRDLKQTK